MGSRSEPPIPLERIQKAYLDEVPLMKKVVSGILLEPGVGEIHGPLVVVVDDFFALWPVF